MNKDTIKEICYDIFISESAQAITEQAVLIIALLYAVFSIRLLGIMMAAKMTLASKNIVEMAKL